MTTIEWGLYVTFGVALPLTVLWLNIWQVKRWPLLPPTEVVGNFDQFRKCTACDWCDHFATSRCNRHICPKCGASTMVAVGRWVRGGGRPLHFEERNL